MYFFANAGKSGGPTVNANNYIELHRMPFYIYRGVGELYPFGIDLGQTAVNSKKDKVNRKAGGQQEKVKNR